jgi:ABC-2 type transport system permease protein
MGTVYALTLRQLTGRWRLAIMSVLAAMPVVLAVIMLRSKAAAPLQAFEDGVLGAILSGSIAPLIVLAIAAAAFANETEDRTLANLTLSPLPRWQIVLPKLLASLTISAPFIAASAFLTAWVAFLGDLTATMAVTLGALMAVAVYAVAFLWLGIVTTQAIGLGLLYIVLWEGFFAGFVAGVRLLSVRYWAIALMHGLDERRFAHLDHPGLWTVVGLGIALIAGFLWLAVRRLRRMDVP